MANFFDVYSLRARIAPAAIFLVPPLFLFLAWWPFDYNEQVFSILIAASTLILVLFSHVVRSLGQKAQIFLYEKWGGKPSVLALRHNNSLIDNPVKQRYHRILAEKISDVVMPSKKSETDNPTFADSQYNIASEWLLSNTRDKAKYPLIFAENVNYGFRRNMYGMKKYAIILYQPILMTNIVLLFEKWITPTKHIDALNILSVISCAFLLTAWIFIVRPSWVKETADDFSRQLYKACDSL
ncbi:MAG: hypothetical protein H6861_08165 [Rhodospirillales bacterium]|nr:hypothetical protein [Rhodospirillales bacterium]